MGKGNRGKLDRPEIKGLLEEGRNLADSGDHIRALNTFDKVIDLNAEHAQAYFERATCFCKLGHYRRAADDIDAACLLGYETAQIWSRGEGAGAGDGLEDELI